MADNITRTTINLPSEVSSEILQKTQEQSAVMQLARQVTLPGHGLTIPVITADPAAEWVAEGAKKPVSNSTLGTKLMQAYKLAVIEVFSEEFTRDAQALYDALIARLPLALANKFDATVIGGTAPGENFDSLAKATAQAITADTAYSALVAADSDIATHNGVVNGFVLSPQARSVLLSAVDKDGRPLFINSVADGAIPMILGSQALVSKAAYKAGTPNIAGVVGDWTQAMYGTVEGVKIDISNQATVGDINLWQQNMVAVRAEIELGFRAGTTVFNTLTIA